MRTARSRCSVIIMKRSRDISYCGGDDYHGAVDAADAASDLYCNSDSAAKHDECYYDDDYNGGDGGLRLIVCRRSCYYWSWDAVVDRRHLARGHCPHRNDCHRRQLKMQLHQVTRKEDEMIHEGLMNRIGRRSSTTIEQMII